MNAELKAKLNDLGANISSAKMIYDSLIDNESLTKDQLNDLEKADKIINDSCDMIRSIAFKKEEKSKYDGLNFFKIYDPIGVHGSGQYIIKIDDNANTPFAIVPVGIGAEQARYNAEIKADHLLRSLNER